MLPLTEEGENGTRPGTFSYTGQGAAIEDGPLYFVEFIAVNHAGLSLFHESEGVKIDSTPPVMDYVSHLTLEVLVTTVDAQWEGMGDVGSARYEPALLPPCPTIRVLSYSN